MSRLIKNKGITINTAVSEEAPRLPQEDNSDSSIIDLTEEVVKPSRPATPSEGEIPTSLPIPAPTSDPIITDSDPVVSFFDNTFWDLWLQKVFRNFASMKFQWLLLVYIPIIWGMFHINVETDAPWISAVTGLSFLGGGFITLATSRMIAKTKLKETNQLNTDQ